MKKNDDKRAPQLLQGNEAIALAAIEAKIRFFAGYPITPSSEIAELMSRELPKYEGKFIQMEDELSSMGAIIGASIAGLKSMTATSGPGFSLMQENIGFACIAEVPCLIVNVMRGGPSTGLPTSPSQGDIMQARWGTHGDHSIIALYPDSVLESYELTIRAVNLSEKYRTPVILLLDEVIAHMRESVILPQKEELNIIERVKPDIPPEWYVHYKDSPDYITPVANFGEGYRFHITSLAHDKYGFPTRKIDEVKTMMDRLRNKIYDNLYDIIQIESYKMQDAEIAIFAAGVVARSAKEAVRIARKQGIKVGLIRPLTIWPFPDYDVQRMLEKCKDIIIAELNQGQLYHEIERVWSERTKSRLHKLQRYDGLILSSEQILSKIAEVK